MKIKFCLFSNLKEDLYYVLNKNLDKKTINKINSIKLDADKWVYIKNNLGKEMLEKINIDSNEEKKKYFIHTKI